MTADLDTLPQPRAIHLGSLITAALCCRHCTFLVSTERVNAFHIAIEISTFGESYKTLCQKKLNNIGQG